MIIAVFAMQLLLLTEGQATQGTNTLKAAAVAPAALGGGGGVCSAGDSAACTLASCAGARKVCSATGTWGTCKCQLQTCGDGGACSVAPTFDVASGWTCPPTPVTNGNACGTDSACNPQTCSGGACVTNPKAVSDGNNCTFDSCSGNGTVSNQNICTSAGAGVAEAFAAPAVAPNPLKYAVPQMPNAGGPRVVENTGDLTYHYSFQLPVARGRYQPSLSVDYSSGSTRNSAFGTGWTLDTPYVETDLSGPPESGGGTTGRKYWLNLGGRGFLLKLQVNGTYLTDQLSGFGAFTRAGGQWSAVDFQGTAFTFGIVVPDQTGAYQGRALLSLVQDVDGNKVAFGYTAHHLSTISYNNFVDGVGTATWGTQIQLTYTNGRSRVDRLGPYGNNSSSLLSTVKVQVRGGLASQLPTTLLRHELNYQQEPKAGTTLLHSIQVMGGDTGGQSLPQTVFTYQPAGAATYSLADGALLGPALGLGVGRWLDLNGDGLPDRIYPVSGTWQRNVTARSSATVPLTPAFLPAVAIPGFAQTNVYAQVPVDDLTGGGATTDFLDMTGDGIPDLITGGTTSTCLFQVWTGTVNAGAYSITGAPACIDGTVLQSLVPIGGNFGAASVREQGTNGLRWTLTDVDGDGLPDFVYFESVPTTVFYGQLGPDLKFSFGAGMPSELSSLFDVNGDGVPGDFADPVPGKRDRWNLGAPGIPYFAAWSFTDLGTGADLGGSPATYTLPVDAALAACPAPPPGSILTGMDSRFQEPRQVVAYTDLNGDGRPEMVWKTRPGDPGCPAVACTNVLNGSANPLCRDPNAAACPLRVWWNTGGGFERETTLAPASSGGGGLADLYPGVELHPADGRRSPPWYCNYMDTNQQAPYSLPSGSVGWSASFVDLDGDGVADYISSDGGVWTYYRGQSTPSLLTGVTTPAGAQYVAAFEPSSTYGASSRDGSLMVVSRLSVTGPGIPSASTSFTYSSPQRGRSGIAPYRDESRGFATTWSWLEQQGLSSKVATRTQWMTALGLLVGRPDGQQVGLFTGAAPTDGNFNPFRKAQFSYDVRLRVNYPGMCASATAGGLNDKSLGIYDSQIPLATLIRTTEILDDGTQLTSEETQACTDLDQWGNQLKKTIDPDTNFLGDKITQVTSYDATATCLTCPVLSTTFNEAGAQLSQSVFRYDSPTGTWSSPLPAGQAGQGRLNYVSRWISSQGQQWWETPSATAYGAYGQVASRVTDPVPMSSSLATTESYTYDAQSLRVTRTTVTDGTSTLVTDRTYDPGTGRLLTEVGPHLVGGTATPRAFAYDGLGRVVAVGTSASVDAAGTWTVNALAATEYVDTSPPVVKSYAMLTPMVVTFGSIGALDRPDVHQVITFKDGLGRAVEVKERLGTSATGYTDPAANVVARLTGFRVVSHARYDEAGRAYASLEPYFSSSAEPDSFDAAATASLYQRGSRTVFDARGRVTCQKSGVYSATAGTSCVTSIGEGLSFVNAVGYAYGSTALNGRTLAVNTILQPGTLTRGSATLTTFGASSSYRSDGMLAQVKDAAGNTVTTSDNGVQVNRTITVTRAAAGGASQVSTSTLDNLGRTVEEWDDNWSPDTFLSRKYSYDALGRAWRVQLPTKALSGYAVRPEVRSEWKSLGRPTTSTLYDPSVTSAGLVYTPKQLAAYSYDTPKASDAVLYPNTAGRLSYLTSPNTTVSFGYDALGHVTRRDQQVAGFGANTFSVTGAVASDGRLLSSTFTSPYSKAVTYTGQYDSAGRPVNIDAGGVSIWSVRNAAKTSYDGHDALGRTRTRERRSTRRRRT